MRTFSPLIRSELVVILSLQFFLAMKGYILQRSNVVLAEIQNSLSFVSCSGHNYPVAIEMQDQERTRPIAGYTFAHTVSPPLLKRSFHRKISHASKLKARSSRISVLAICLDIPKPRAGL
jgi:hypothetical protein